MDRWLEALAAIGGFAAIGGLIDLAMYKSEKVKLCYGALPTASPAPQMRGHFA
jgi:hypothetical protein